MSKADKHGEFRDAKDLRRGVTVNLIGYVTKSANPLLMALATSLYGAAEWGVFIALQSAMMLVARVCLLGFDKALLWSVPRQEDGRPHGLLAALGIVAAATTAITLVVWFFGAAVLSLFNHHGSASTALSDIADLETLRIMSLALLPFCATELLIHATMGKRKMGLQVFIRDGFTPAFIVVVAALLYFTPLQGVGLAYGFLISHIASFGLALLGFFRVFRGQLSGLGYRLQSDMVRYAVPLWVTEFFNTLLQRLDVIVLATLLDARSLGIYAVASQVANQFRGIRRAFDPMVLAIVSGIHAENKDAFQKRLRTGFSHATNLVQKIQYPVFVVMVFLGPWILGIFGSEFRAGSTVLTSLCVLWLLNGVFGLCGMVILGFGKTTLFLIDTVLAVGIQYGLLLVLPKAYGLMGAAVAVGLSIVIQNIIQLFQMRKICNQWNYNNEAFSSFRYAVMAASATLLTYYSLAAASPLIQRVMMTGVFLAVYGILLLRERKRASSG
ncbi:MAG: oligosaccharide flippase family protein [Myxococcales bacterium]|nr:MAG: oligosaccharide flippase family protein [Myxococcales bacterium]